MNFGSFIENYREADHTEDGGYSDYEDLHLYGRIVCCSVRLRQRHAAINLAATATGATYHGGTSVGTQQSCDDL